MTYLVIDFETKDTHLMELGSGWATCFGTNNFKVLGCSVRTDKDITAYWIDFVKDEESAIAELSFLVNQADELIAFNAQYDFGILVAYGIDLKPKLLKDVMLFAKMYDNSLYQYNLDAMAKKYLNIGGKDTDELARYIFTAGLYKQVEKEVDLKWISVNLPKFRKYAKSNMDEIYQHNPELLIKYANKDVDLTHDLLKFYETELAKW